MKRYRIHYTDKFHESKTLVYEAENYAEVDKFSKTLGNVVSIDALDADSSYEQTTYYHPLNNDYFDDFA